MNKLKTAWAWLVNWFERGDLVPLIVLVSAVHYADVLRGKDAPAVAVAIGLLVDLGHYRTIRAAVRYNGASRWHTFTRWLIAAGMTALSLNYHERFYNDWWLSVPLPLLIAALAWLQHVDQRTGTRRAAEPTKASETPPLEIVAVSEPYTYTCPCGYGTNDQRAFAGHKSAHSRAKSNGRALISRAE